MVQKNVYIYNTITQSEVKHMGKFRVTMWVWTSAASFKCKAVVCKTAYHVDVLVNFCNGSCIGSIITFILCLIMRIVFTILRTLFCSFFVCNKEISFFWVFTVWDDSVCPCTTVTILPLHLCSHHLKFWDVRVFETQWTAFHTGFIHAQIFQVSWLYNEFSSQVASSSLLHENVSSFPFDTTLNYITRDTSWTLLESCWSTYNMIEPEETRCAVAIAA